MLLGCAIKRREFLLKAAECISVGGHGKSRFKQDSVQLSHGTPTCMGRCWSWLQGNSNSCRGGHQVARWRVHAGEWP